MNASNPSSMEIPQSRSGANASDIGSGGAFLSFADADSLTSSGGAELMLFCIYGCPYSFCGFVVLECSYQLETEFKRCAHALCGNAFAVMHNA